MTDTEILAGRLRPAAWTTEEALAALGIATQHCDELEHQNSEQRATITRLQFELTAERRRNA